MDISEIRRYVKNLRGENRTLKLEIQEYQKENARLHEIIKTLETQAVENLKEQGFIK
jgi:regulator of replication initiation timing|tara:strand:- start:7 stop:177 length:171 start_codon:yes stop_codon:yes gene_type:complete